MAEWLMAVVLKSTVPQDRRRLRLADL